MGGIISAVEPRVKAAVLYVAGLTMERSLTPSRFRLRSVSYPAPPPRDRAAHVT